MHIDVIRVHSLLVSSASDVTISFVFSGMSLCEACFDANGHEGHDYMRFFSREGGACDCGNQDVIKEQGNCPDHGDESKRPKYNMSDVCLAEHIVTKLLVRLFLDYRGWVRNGYR